METEFSRPHRLDRIGAGDSRVSVQAEEAERTALAARFGLRARSFPVARIVSPSRCSA